ncbi:RxLR effector protein SFI6 [Phytophthora ramorum]|nr:RxLR effector protein SFI6 [Phytophthora ramorum]
MDDRPCTCNCVRLCGKVGAYHAWFASKAGVQRAVLCCSTPSSVSIPYFVIQSPRCFSSVPRPTMRLPSILLVVSALTLFASGTALSADTDKGVMVSTMASPDSGLLDVGHNSGKRFLRVHETANEDDGSEERLSGANMFSTKKIKQAMADPNYAKTLFRRWKRNGVEADGAFNKLKAYNIDNDNVFRLYKNYFTWLKTRHPVGVVTGDKKMFDETKLKKAMGDGTYANTLFGRWKRNGLDSDEVFTRFQKMGVKKDNNLYKLYTDYFAWLQIHHPIPGSQKVSAKDFLFDSTRLNRAMKDTTFAEKLFAKWKTSGLDSDPVFVKFRALGSKKGDNKLDKLYRDYFKWLEIHYPTAG